MAYRQGDIVLVSFPFTDLSSSKRRPALVLSPDSFNAAGEDLVLAAVTSHITDDPNASPRRTGSTAKGRGEIATTLAIHLTERAKALEPLGWTGRRAEWIALACFHGGVFTRQQWTSVLGSHHETVRRAVRKLVAQGVASEEKPHGINGIGRICRIHGRKIYRALGAGDRRRRRITSPAVLMRRLLALDYVLEHPRLPWLPTDADRLAAFEALGIERKLLPQRFYRGGLRRFFPLRLPIALDTERAVFVYAEPGHETATALRSWGAAHGDLWKALWDMGHKIEVVAVARRWKEITGRAGCSPTGHGIPVRLKSTRRPGAMLARIEQAILEGVSGFSTSTVDCRRH